MANTGSKGFTTLEEYYTDNNAATGITKPNASYLPEYAWPIFDTIGCPVSNNTLSYYPDRLMVAANYDTFDVNIESNYDDLTFRSDESWIFPSPSGNSGNIILAVTVDQNWDYYPRYGTIYIYYFTTWLATITVEQSA